MLSKSDAKYINSLQNKKYRKTEGAFFVEGHKNVQELFNSEYEIIKIYCTPEYLPHFEASAQTRKTELQIISGAELADIGTLENNTSALALVRIKEGISEFEIKNELVLALDGINDPGNLGTIIRIADWYGIKNIVCSTDTVDLYNPKVINATKGSFTRVNVSYTQLKEFFENNTIVPVTGAFMEGTSVYKAVKSLPMILLLGNEANGIRSELNNLLTYRVTIPRRGGCESLNVGVAAGILIDRFLE